MKLRKIRTIEVTEEQPAVRKNSPEIFLNEKGAVMLKFVHTNYCFISVYIFEQASASISMHCFGVQFVYISRINDAMQLKHEFKQ